VTLVVHPRSPRSVRVHVLCKSSVRHAEALGPLFDGAVVDLQALPGLVRATAMQSTTLVRAQQPGFRPFYTARQDLLAAVAGLATSGGEGAVRLPQFDEFATSLLTGVPVAATV
jgi:hypothetical protein